MKTTKIAAIQINDGRMIEVERSQKRFFLTYYGDNGLYRKSFDRVGFETAVRAFLEKVAGGVSEDKMQLVVY